LNIDIRPHWTNKYRCNSSAHLFEKIKEWKKFLIGERRERERNQGGEDEQGCFCKEEGKKRKAKLSVATLFWREN